MKFGHHGGNVPVKDIAMGRTLITSQNHGYQVDVDSLKGTDLELTHYAINDDTVEGVKHKKYPAFTVQYHPEAHPGPRDSKYLFDQFIERMKSYF
jgi:carbamoyl-phosphate synthase small subunit